MTSLARQLLWFALRDQDDIESDCRRLQRDDSIGRTVSEALDGIVTRCEHARRSIRAALRADSDYPAVAGRISPPAPSEAEARRRMDELGDERAMDEMGEDRDRFADQIALSMRLDALGEHLIEIPEPFRGVVLDALVRNIEMRPMLAESVCDDFAPKGA